MERLASLRVWLLAAMLGAAAIGVTMAYITVGSIEHAREASGDRAKAQAVANAVARQAEAGETPAGFARLQQMLPNDQLTIVHHGAVVFRGPLRASQPVELTATAAYPGGRVTLVDHATISSGDRNAVAIAAISVVLLVIAAALVVSARITRSVREPLARAIAVSDRIAGGDLTARMGESGPDALSHLGAAMDDMADRLQEVDRNRRRFLADVTHEIATPVNTIVGYATAIADGTAAEDRERERAERAISDACERVGRLLASLRELTTLDLYGEPHAAPFDLADLVDDVVERQRPAARDGSVTLDLDVHRAGVVTDSRLLETILENLLSNAIRYTPAGGQVVVGARADASDLELWVSDSGPGIPPDQQRWIFDDLYRTDVARRQTTGGSGMGLSIARRAALALGGTIRVVSAPRAGSTFTVHVPLRTRAAHARPTASP